MSAAPPPFDPSREAVLRRACELALAYLDQLDTAPVGATVSGEELRRRVERPLPEQGLGAERALDRLAADVAGGLLGNAGGRFFGWVMGASVPAALAADWLTSAWDQVAGSFAVSPSASVVEEVCGRWLLSLLRLPSEASFALVTGCQMAHFTCLAAARNQLLAQRGWDVEQRGLRDGPACVVLLALLMTQALDGRSKASGWAVSYGGLGAARHRAPPVCAHLAPGARWAHARACRHPPIAEPIRANRASPSSPAPYASGW